MVAHRSGEPPGSTELEHHFEMGMLTSETTPEKPVVQSEIPSPKLPFGFLAPGKNEEICPVEMSSF